MRIRIVAAASVADGAGRRFTNGQTPDVDDAQAAAWIAAGHAEPHTGGKQVKGGRRQATRRAPRTAAKKPAEAPSPNPTPDATDGDEADDTDA